MACRRSAAIERDIARNRHRSGADGSHRTVGRDSGKRCQAISSTDSPDDHGQRRCAGGARQLQGIADNRAGAAAGQPVKDRVSVNVGLPSMRFWPSTKPN